MDPSIMLHFLIEINLNKFGLAYGEDFLIKFGYFIETNFQKCVLTSYGSKIIIETLIILYFFIEIEK